jgi:putative SOS response-associated peptidase YedK
MCGRFTLHQSPEDIITRFLINNIPFEFIPRYNIAPSQLIPGLYTDHHGQRRITLFKWGLIPSWAKDEKIGFKMINARAESLMEKPAFKNLITGRRCVIPADGFYEWQQIEGGKQPKRILLNTEEPFGMAGLFDSWKSPDGRIVNSCTIITTRPNELISPIHDRMPVILNKKTEEIWLNPSIQDAKYLQSLLEPYDAEQMKVYSVSSLVGNPRNDEPTCIKEVF